MIELARAAGWTNYSLLTEVEVKRLERFAKFVADAKESQILDLLEALHEQVRGRHNYYQHAIRKIMEFGNASND